MALRSMESKIISIIWLAALCVAFLAQSEAKAAVKLDNNNNNTLGGRIINGTVASLNGTKHQVSLRRRTYDQFFFGSGHICGGSLIEPNVVLTAAHCFLNQELYNGTYRPASDFIIVMGTLDRYRRTDYTLTFEIEKLVLGIQVFNVSTYEDDIAVVFLNGSVPLGFPTIEKAKRARVVPPAGTVCQATGWGQTEEGWNSDILMTVDLPLIAHDVCANDTDLAAGLVRDGMLCAGYEKGEKDACAGDSGGPLVCNGELTGIVSWGISCALPRLPGVYTDVAYWGDWIDKVLGVNTTKPGGNNTGNSNNTGNGNNTGSGNNTGGGGGGNTTGGGGNTGGGAMSNFSHSAVLLIMLVAWSTLMRYFE